MEDFADMRIPTDSSAMTIYLPIRSYLDIKTEKVKIDKKLKSGDSS